jgi:predicted HTH transcriptional regulator
VSLPIAITNLLHGHSVEWERLQFKEYWNPLRVLHTIRKNSNTVRATGADLDELLRLTASVPLDDQENTRATVADLSRELIVEYLQEVNSDLAEAATKLPIEELGRRMGMVGGLAEMPTPINVGLLFFSHEPWRFFPYTRITLSRPLRRLWSTRSTIAITARESLLR